LSHSESRQFSGEEEDSLPFLSTTATNKRPIGQYPIVVKQGTLRLISKNYSFNFVNGIVNVVEKAPKKVVFGLHASFRLFCGLTGNMRNQWLRALVGFVCGLLLFFGVARSLRLGLDSAGQRSAVVSQVVLKSSLVVVALIGWKLLGKPLSEMGWRSADWRHRSYLFWFAIAVASMMAASVAMIFLGARHPVVSQMSFLQIVVVVWLLSSLSEEIYVRGLVQSWVAERGKADGTSSAFEPSIVSSALLFAAMHAPLIWSPTGVKGGMVIVLAMVGVGWACAVLRARSRSLLPAIACHVVGNVSGVAGGILGVILYRLVYGRLPEILTAG
jgi:membrane protease YdiL (CAAX protease family)